MRPSNTCFVNHSLPDEIIVVDDGSTDETANILKSFGNRIRVLSKTNGGPASARNAGVRSSIGTLIAFTDSDCFPDENWLQEMVKGFHSLRIGGVGGMVCGVSDGLIGEYVDLHGWMNPQCAGDGSVLYLVTANACFRSDVLFRANLFDERFRKAGGEDTELSVRLRNFGYELAFVESAIVRHRHKRTIRDYLKNIANHGEAQFILERLWPQQTWKANHAYGDCAKRCRRGHDDQILPILSTTTRSKESVLFLVAGPSSIPGAHLGLPSWKTESFLYLASKSFNAGSP